MTACAPILRQLSTTKNDEEFYGALCLDSNPSGPLDDYYPFDENDQATYLIFNEDEAFDSITRIEDSKFKDYITQIIGSKIKEG